MPRLKNPRQEKFAQLVAQGQTKTDAARLAGYGGAGLGGNASNLAKKPHVAARIEELTQDMIAHQKAIEASRKETIHQVMTTGEVDLDWVLAELKINLDMARDAGNLAGANKAVELMARAVGIVQDSRGAAKKNPKEPLNVLNAPPQIDVSQIHKVLGELDRPIREVISEGTPNRRRYSTQIEVADDDE